MKKVIVVFAERKYEIGQLPIRANREWRARFDEPVNKLLAAFQDVGKVANNEYADGKEMVKQIGAMLLSRAGEVAGLLLESMDLVLDGLFAYSPALQADRDWIETHATDDEAVNAFIEVLKLAFPFGGFMELLGQLGRKEESTSPSSPAPNGG